MGDRANIFIVQKRDADGNATHGVGVYAHWAGLDLFDAALAALPKAMKRVGDPSYFTRILIQNVLDALADANDEYGFGIWSDGPDDNEHPILVIDANTGQTYKTDENSYRVRAPFVPTLR